MENKITTLHTFVICAYGESPYLEDCLVSLKKSGVCITIVTLYVNAQCLN